MNGSQKIHRAETISAVDRYVQDAETCRALSSRHYHALANFYTDGRASTDYAGPAYAEARKLLIKRLKARDDEVRNECQRMLEQWNQMPVQETDVTFSSLSAAEKVTVFPSHSS